MSIHWRGKCFTVSYIDCQIPVETKWNKRQPNLVLQGFATAVTITDDTATII